MMTKGFDTMDEFEIYEDDDIIVIIKSIAEYERIREEKIVYLNPKKALLLKKVYRNICLMLDKCNCKYEILAKKLFGGVGIFIKTFEANISISEMPLFREIIADADSFDMNGHLDGKIMISIGINDVFTNAEELGLPTNDGLPLD